MSNIYDYIESGFKVFGIHKVINGKCQCSRDECDALYKHPVISGWQNVPYWSDDQIETFQQMGHFDVGFGVLCSGYFIIDVDARNGGVKSFKKLCEKYPSAASSKFVVNTGSGGGSQHHYFSLAEPLALLQGHKDYPGIDFKTSGYVIGAGSLHASGNIYEVERGFPQDIGLAPSELLELLAKPMKHRVSTPDGDVDVSHSDISELIKYIDPDISYEHWVKIGMAVNHCLEGDGFDIWDQWSSKGKTYPGTSQLERHWHSFGKSLNPAKYGALLHYARQGGYVEDVTFEYECDDPLTLDTTAVDLSRPPGFVGELTEWINGQCLYPRENLAVAAALVAVSSLAGMRFVDELDDMTGNMIAFCVAGSGTGKESVQQAYLKIMREAGIQAAVHGSFKSEQELLRNLIRHQSAFYAIDELGIQLRKVENAQKRGGASYLEGLLGTVMSVYSKANGFLPVSGDLKEEIREIFRKELSKVEKAIDDLPQDSASENKLDKLTKQSDRVRESLKKIDDGLEAPFLNILGYTTPVTFDDLMGFEQATNGFMARAMIFSDLETNPRRKKGFKKIPMSDYIRNSIRNLWAPGMFDMMDTIDRVEYIGRKTAIPTTKEATDLMEQVYEEFHRLAEEQKGATGLEAIARRGYELASKLSLLLAIPGGVRAPEHVLWGYAAARRDVDYKIKLAFATDNENDNGLAAKILTLITKDQGETEGVICNRLRNTPKEQVKALLRQMVDKKMIKVEESKIKSNGAIVRRYIGC